MDHSTPGIPVHHQLPEFTQTHVHCISDAIQPSHPLSSPSPLALNLSQHQGLFKWVSTSHHWPKYWNFSFIVSPTNLVRPLGWTSWISLQSKGLKNLLQHRSSKISTKTRPGADCDSYNEILIAKVRLEKVGKTTMLFRYDLNQIPYDYTVEVTSNFIRSDRRSAWRTIDGGS